VEAANAIIEYETAENPRYVVDSRNWGHGAKASEENGNVDISPERERETAS